MPQDPLTQTLIQRGLPETLSPDQQASQNGAPLAGLRKPFEGAMDGILSALGIREQRPGVNMTGAGAMLVAGTPFLKGLKGLSGLAEGERYVPENLRELFATNPKAEPAYHQMMEAAAPDFMAAHRAAQAEKLGHLERTNSALKELDATGHTSTPMFNGEAFQLAMPNQAEMSSHPNASVNKRLQMQLDNSGLSPEIIKDIRLIGPEAATKKYHSINPSTIYGIAKGDSWGSIK